MKLHDPIVRDRGHLAEPGLEPGREGIEIMDFYIKTFNSTCKLKLESLELYPFYYQSSQNKSPQPGQAMGDQVSRFLILGSSLVIRLCWAIVPTLWCSSPTSEMIIWGRQKIFVIAALITAERAITPCLITSKHTYHIALHLVFLMFVSWLDKSLRVGTLYWLLLCPQHLTGAST